MSLYAWQSEMARRVAELPAVEPSTDRPPRGLVAAAAPGAGKSLATVAAAHACGARRVLVVSPAGRVARQWVAAMTDRERLSAMDLGAPWQARLVGGPGVGGPKLGAELVRQLGLDRDLMPGERVAAVLPMSRLQRKVDSSAVLQALGGCSPFDLLVVDELHMAQGCESVAGGLALFGSAAKFRRNSAGAWVESAPAVAGLRHRARRTIGCTGTPVTSRPASIRACLLLAGLDAEKGLSVGNRFAYEKRYWGGAKVAERWATVWRVSDRATPEHASLVARSVLRVDPAELARQLPSHRREIVADFDAGPELEGEAGAELAEYLEGLSSGRGRKLPQLAEIAKARVSGTRARAEQVAEMVADWHGEAEDGRAMVIWCCYVESTEVLARAVREACGDARVETLHGGMADAQRAAVLDAATRGAVRVLVATGASTGVGVDGLQMVASDQVIAEIPWTPGEAEQWEGRVVRTGQARPVLTRWVAAGIEGRIAQGVGAKAGAIADVLRPAAVAGLTGTAYQTSSGTPQAPKSAEPAQAQAVAADTRQDIPEPSTLTWGWGKSRDGEWLARCPHEAAGADWEGEAVDVVASSGAVKRVVLGERVAGGPHGGGWSLWRHEPEDAGARDRRILAERAERRGVDVPQNRPLTTGEMEEAERLHAAACQLTAMDADHARERNGEGWSQADGGVGRRLAGLAPEDWDAATLALARQVVRKYQRQVGRIEEVRA